MSELVELQAAISTWRADRDNEKDSRKANPQRNPYGKRIHGLNMDWAAAKAEHEAKLAAARAEYDAEYAKLRALHAQWEGAQPDKAKVTAGRPSTPHPDAVKIAAARARNAGVSKTLVRSLLGIANTEKLNALLREGQELLRREEGEDW